MAAGRSEIYVGDVHEDLFFLHVLVSEGVGGYWDELPHDIGVVFDIRSTHITEVHFVTVVF